MPLIRATKFACCGCGSGEEEEKVMSQRVVSTYYLGTALFEEGLVPLECFNVEIKVPYDGIMTLHYDVHVRSGDIEKITRAMLKVAEANK